MADNLKVVLRLVRHLARTPLRRILAIMTLMLTFGLVACLIILALTLRALVT